MASSPNRQVAYVKSNKKQSVNADLSQGLNVSTTQNVSRLEERELVLPRPPKISETNSWIQMVIRNLINQSFFM